MTGFTITPKLNLALCDTTELNVRCLIQIALQTVCDEFHEGAWLTTLL